MTDTKSRLCSTILENMESANSKTVGIKKLLIITNDRPYSKQCKTLNVLNSVPSEYQKIVGYEWFLGMGLN